MGADKSKFEDPFYVFSLNDEMKPFAYASFGSEENAKERATIMNHDWDHAQSFKKVV